MSDYCYRLENLRLVVPAAPHGTKRGINEGAIWHGARSISKNEGAIWHGARSINKNEGAILCGPRSINQIKIAKESHVL